MQRGGGDFVVNLEMFSLSSYKFDEQATHDFFLLFQNVTVVLLIN